MKRAIAFMWLSVIVFQYAYAEKVKVLSENLRYPEILANDEFFVIADTGESKIYTYKKEKFEKVAEFGRRGEGPGEFVGVSEITLYDDAIYISHFPRISIFSLEGDLEKELKASASVGGFIPIGKKFIGVKYPYSKPDSAEGEVEYLLYDSDLDESDNKLITRIKSFFNLRYNPKTQKKVNRFLTGCYKAVVFQEKIFLADAAKEYLFLVFDSDGGKLYEIRREYVKRAVTSEYKTMILNNIKRNMGVEKWKRFNQRYEIEFPDDFPAFSDFTIDEGLIYVFLTPGMKDQYIEVLDLKGKLLYSKIIPLVKETGVDNWKWRLCVDKGKLYYVDYNENDENWEVHSLSLSGMRHCFLKRR